MLHFDSDYMEGAHPLILKKLNETNFEQLPGYGTDRYCESARVKIRKACSCPQAEVYFLVGGTQANETVINTLLHPWEGVICASTGHINVHEAGAVEHGGHKVLTLPSHDGKMIAGELENYMIRFNEDENREHMVMPGMVYLSQATEYGTLYTKKELTEIKKICKSYGMHLFVDGARLGYALGAESNDVSLSDLATLCDIFTIGGTKVGALFGEAVIMPKPDLIPHFYTMIKQHGGMLAKGWLIGIQFDILFTDNLYIDLGRHADEMAMKIKTAIKSLGLKIYIDSPTDQQFIIIKKELMDKLSEYVSFGYMEATDDDHCVIRFCTSWATKEEDVNKLTDTLKMFNNPNT